VSADSTALTAIRIAAGSGILLAGLLALYGWVRGRERRRGYLAMALGCLGLAALGAPLQPVLGHPTVERAVVIVLFEISAAGMLAYRNSIVALPRWGMVVAGLALAGVATWGLVAGLPQAANLQPLLGGPAAGLSTGQRAAADAVVAVWALAVLEPAYRLVRISRGLPRVQRARLRSLAIGYLLLAITLLVGEVAAQRVSPTPVSLALGALALGCVPLFYASFMPPRWRRRRWRQEEQDDLTRATHDLLLFSPDRRTLARRGLEWAVRLVGGSGGLVSDAGAELLAFQGVRERDARALLGDPRIHPDTDPVRVGPRGRTAIVQGLGTSDAQAKPEPGKAAAPGLLVVVSGPLSPVFGRDEVEWLQAYAAALTIALERGRVTELQAETEAELRRARDLAEDASRAKSEFLSRMSHELRTPLTAMLGFAELLLLGNLTETQQVHVKTILRAGDHLLALINDILDVARIEEGRLDLSPQSVSVPELVNGVLALAQPLARERTVSLAAKAVPADLRVTADSQRLTQVLLNLVSNAVKYNRKRGWVRVAAAVQEDGLARITVADSGPGLTGEEVGRLFQPFERLWAADSDVEGTGLGLSLSKSLVEAMGGRIGVDTAPGSGSRFWVELPAVLDGRAAQAAGGGAGPAGAKLDGARRDPGGAAQGSGQEGIEMSVPAVGPAGADAPAG
jgi:signal transduction histidine kinase